MQRNAPYAQVEIRIFARRDSGYPVELTVNGEQEYGSGLLSADRLEWRSSTDPVEDGEQLFEWLFADRGLRSAWNKICGEHSRRRVRLRIDPPDPELHSVPWERLRDVDAAPTIHLAAAAATPFSRYLPGQQQPGSPIFKRPLRVLVAIADPAGLGQYALQSVDVETETTLLRAAVERLDIELDFVPQPCTFAAIERALKGGHHVLHVICHGTFNPEAQTSALLLADSEDDQATEPELVRAEAVREMLARQLAQTHAKSEDKLSLVVLAACQDFGPRSADAFRGFGPQLLEAGVPAVISMQDRVTVETARLFTQTFYQRLLAHGQVDLASNEARSQLLTRARADAAVPVLFQRLRSGRLLGSRGRVSSGGETFWPFLVENLDRGRCIPFLGPRIEEGLVPRRSQIARQLAKKYSYPLSDKDDLARVAQFIALMDRPMLRNSYLRLLKESLLSHPQYRPKEREKERYEDVGLSDAIAKLRWAKRAQDLDEAEIHHLLAEFELPVYITTNPGSFMFEALAHREGVTPRRVGPRWESRVGQQYNWKRPPGRTQPVVFHLNGSDRDAEEERYLVLSEDDYLRHLVRLANDQDRCLPQDLLGKLSNSSLLFLGYSFDDWEFRVLLHGLLESIERGASQSVNVELQLEPKKDVNTEAALKYLSGYLKEDFKINVYWGTPLEFLTELRDRWRAFGESDDEDWS